MCQTEIYNFMRDLRISGDDEYYTPTEILQLMRRAKREVSVKRFYDKVTRLWWFGFFEKKEILKKGKGSPYSRRQFRAKE